MIINILDEEKNTKDITNAFFLLVFYKLVLLSTDKTKRLLIFSSVGLFAN